MDRLGLIGLYASNAGNVANFYHLRWNAKDGEKLAPSARSTPKKGKTLGNFTCFCLQKITTKVSQHQQ